MLDMYGWAVYGIESKPFTIFIRDVVSEEGRFPDSALQVI